jgi:hypothetical protein
MGSINRFQRQTGAIDLKYNDAAPSLPIAYATSLWGVYPLIKLIIKKTQN